MATGVVDNTYYDLLEVPRDSTEPVIKKAYYKAAQRYHPDKPGGDTEKFKDIKLAYEVLMDTDKRKLYDLYGKSMVPPAGAPPAPGPTSQAYYDPFYQQAPTQKSREINYPLPVSVKGLYNGTRKTVKVIRSIACTLCSGRGDQRCRQCKGVKVLRHIKLITVEIDRGMRYGTRINFFGEGDQLPGMLSGDVVCVLAKKAENKNKWRNWKIKDDDLHFTKNIELVEALTNEEIAFHHLDSREIKCTWDYNVVFSPGSVIRLRGQGMPILGKFGEFGDLFAHLQVIFPSEVSDEQKSLLIKALGLPPPPPPLNFIDDRKRPETVRIGNPKIIQRERFEDMRENKELPENGVSCATQ